MIILVRAHWGLGSDVLADVFLPDGSAETKAHFVRLQRGAAPAEVACELLAQCYETRIEDLLDVERIRLRLGVTSRAQVAAWWAREARAER